MLRTKKQRTRSLVAIGGRSMALVALMTATVVAQEHQPEPSSPTASPVMKTAALETPSPSTLRATPTTTTSTVATSPAQPPRAETLEEIVERVKRKLAQQGPARPPAKTTAVAPVPAPRVKLVWRPSVVWPAELAGEPASMPPAQKRVTLSWEPVP